MDSNLVLVFIFMFFVLGAGGSLYWKMKKIDAKSLDNTTTVNEIDTNATHSYNHNQDAQMSPWINGKCKTLSGTCGKGTMNLTRQCLKDGYGDGKRCVEETTTKKQDCYVQCSRPKNVIDWGHPDDAKGLPVGSPRKGWYDISGQGQPNDYCRWVGEPKSRFWACHVEKDPYVEVDPSHISFSGGPANRSIPFHPQLITKMCPIDHNYLLEARDPDLRKSIANGFLSHCGAKCVYDHRNPKSGWYYDGKKWDPIPDTSKHVCGTLYKNEMKKAMSRYEMMYDVKNAFELTI